MACLVVTCAGFTMPVNLPAQLLHQAFIVGIAKPLLPDLHQEDFFPKFIGGLRKSDKNSIGFHFDQKGRMICRLFKLKKKAHSRGFHRMYTGTVMVMLVKHELIVNWYAYGALGVE